jgi:hypothetical protein
MKKTLAIIVLALVGCGMTAQQWANIGITVSQDVCTFISQDDPNAPTSVKVACKVDGIAAPVLVNLPWNAWQAALAGKTTSTVVVSPEAGQ